MVFHSACSALSASAVAIQSVESASASAFSQSASLRAEVLHLLRVLRRAQRLHPLAHGLGGRAETGPQRLGLIARRRGHGLPLFLQLAHLAEGDVGVGFGAKRDHLLDELFLHAGIGPALPVVGLAQLGRLGLQQFP